MKIAAIQVLAALPPKGEVWEELVLDQDATIVQNSLKRERYSVRVRTSWDDSQPNYANVVSTRNAPRRAWNVRTGEELFIAKGRPGQNWQELLFTQDPGPRPGSQIDTVTMSQEVSVFADRMEELGALDLAAHLREIAANPKLIFVRWRKDLRRG